MKYYFITYQATSRSGINSTWNQVIDRSPMAFIKMISDIEKNGVNKGHTYINFVIINTCEITKEEFNEFDGRF